MEINNSINDALNTLLFFSQLYGKHATSTLWAVPSDYQPGIFYVNHHTDIIVITMNFITPAVASVRVGNSVYI